MGYISALTYYLILLRCRMQDAEACFMIAARNYTDKTAAVSFTLSQFTHSVCCVPLLLIHYYLKKTSLSVSIPVIFA